MNSILKVDGLTRIYGRGCSRCLEATGPEQEGNQCRFCDSVVALGDIGLELHRGEVLGVMGESGSGKSTLVRQLIFEDAPTLGNAVLRKRDGEEVSLFEVNAAKQRRLRNHHFGMVYQNPNLGLNFSVSAGGNIAEQLLMAGKRHYGEIRGRAEHYLDRTEIPTARMDDLPGTFSGGMQQRVQIAKALVTNPDILFLDEVTTGLDLSVQARILDLILELRHESDVSMLVVTHDLGVIRLLASRTMVMKNGRVVETGLTDQILEDPQHAYTQQLVASAL